ncbi:rhamnulokinase [Paenibacillus crassostreae]|uniref:Carbohydrate kinase n=1 Tax=Paenibacillus crassostreae TaxID=1763538 RepID=A0A167FU29_9BACL|nr:rhamnulokinase family protein [Paenibacillus crassostreae]AOZ94064.1 rhamnulokinase [Paenibacillus crassostreae]OAB76900.1 carbohydrate kinase [Paenibacillus crassostreae]
MNVLAYDLGASSGRAVIGHLKDSKMEVEEIHRFSNDPVHVGDRLHWDILRLIHEIKQGLLITKVQKLTIKSLAIDSWAVDFGMIGQHGELIGNPYHYRDQHTDGMMEKVLAKLPMKEIFSRTGIQFLSINTLYQLASLQQAGSPLLKEGKHLLMIPDLLRYFLSGEAVHEFTNATTTQMYNPVEGQWDSTIIQRMGFQESWFGRVVQPGTHVGQLSSGIRHELGLASIPIYTAAEHDTASAVVAVPATERSFAYLICGTWSLMGTEVQEPILSDLVLELNFTNEGGAYGTYRLLKNIMGLWILQECRREWERAGLVYSFPELVQLAQQATPFYSLIDPDDLVFMPSGDMSERIRNYAVQTGQKSPEGIGAVVRCILESLALKYRYVLELTERLSGQNFQGLHMVGGGIHNTLLCQWTANAVGKPVWAGPAEGSAIGNLTVQWIAHGDFLDVWEARRVIRDSFPITIYEPEQFDMWEEAYGQFRRITCITK